MRKRLWDLAKSRIEIGTILPGHRHKVRPRGRGGPPEAEDGRDGPGRALGGEVSVYIL